MVDITAPLQTEPLLDPETGLPTIRYATFFDNISKNADETNTGLDDGLSGLESELQKLASVQPELQKAINDIDQMSTGLSSLSAKMAEIRKEINDSMELINDASDAKAQIAELKKKIRDIEELI